jgi:hypothetical protein
MLFCDLSKNCKALLVRQTGTLPARRKNHQPMIIDVKRSLADIRELTKVRRSDGIIMAVS